MDDDWDDNPTMVAPAPLEPVNNNVQTGRALPARSTVSVQGRGFARFTESDEGNEYGDRDTHDGDRGGRGGRGNRRGRGGPRGRGDRGNRGGGSGPYRDYSNGGDNGDDSGRGDGDGFTRGRGRGGGRGSRGGGRGDSHSPTEDGDGAPAPAPVTYVPPEPTEDEGEIFSSTITSGINFEKFDRIAIKVTGENAPPPITSFDTAGLRKYVLDNITKSGYKKPTPIQKYAIPIIMNGRDLMGCAQTGSGKTAAFLLPIINTLLQDPQDLVAENFCAQPQVVVISPTRELTIQIFSEARKFAYGSILKIAVAYGGTAVRHQGDNIAKGCHILVATPGRLMDFVNRRRVSFESVRFMVLDEADRMLDMGFMPDVEKIMEHSSMVPKTDRQTLMFSATFPEDIQHLAGRFLNDYLFVAVGIVGGASTDVEQTFIDILTPDDKKTKLKSLIEENPSKRIMVFVETQRTADFLGSLLSETCSLTTTIHGGRMQNEREEALTNFKSGRHRILVATAVAARGLDIKNVDIVVNFDLPKSIDEYVHRIGRTGRVGNRGKAVSFFNSDKDMALVGDLAKILRQADQTVPDFLVGGGSASYTRSHYGGSDIRNFNNAASSATQGQEPEEEW